MHTDSALLRASVRSSYHGSDFTIHCRRTFGTKPTPMCFLFLTSECLCFFFLFVCTLNSVICLFISFACFTCLPVRMMSTRKFASKFVQSFLFVNHVALFVHMLVCLYTRVLVYGTVDIALRIGTRLRHCHFLCVNTSAFIFPSRFSSISVDVSSD